MSSRLGAWCAALAVLCLTAAAAQDGPIPSPKPEVVEAVRTQLEQAGDALAAGQFDRAATLARQARASGKDLPWAQAAGYLMEGQALLAQRNWVAADTALKQVVDKFGDWPEAPTALLAQGDARRGQQRLTEARAAYERVLRDYPHSPERLLAAERLFHLELEQQAFDAAAKRLDAELTAMPWLQAGPDMLVSLGYALLDAGKPEQALPRLQRALAQYGNTPVAASATRGTAEALVALKRHDEAWALLAPVRPELAALADLVNLRVEVLLAQQKPDEAVAALVALGAQYPGTHVAALAALRAARVELDRDRYDAALALLQPLRTAFPQPYWQAQILRAQYQATTAAKRWEAAEDAALELVGLTEGTALGAQSLLDLAEAQRGAGHNRAARLSLEKVIQKYKGPPAVPQAQQMLGELPAE